MIQHALRDRDGGISIFNLSLPAIIALGMILRIIWALIIPVVPLSDSHAYDTFALNIWQHGVYGWTADSPTSYWPVGTSALYALVYQVFGHSYGYIVALNILMSFGIILYAYKVAHLFVSDPVARFCALLIAIWPTSIFFVTVLASELPYTLLTLAGAYHFLAEDRFKLRNILIVGVSFALAYYIRSLATTVLAICAFCGVVACGKPLLPTVYRALVVGLIMAVAVLPWAKRNYDLYGHFVPMSTNGGAVFWMGNTPGTSGGYHQLPDYVEGLDEHQRNQLLKAEAMEYIKSEPGSFVVRTFAKFLKFHSHETIGVTWNEEGINERFGEAWLMPLKLLSQGFWMVCLLGGIAGAFMFVKEKPLPRLFHPLLILWLSSAGLHALIVAQDRYHLPVVPFIGVFCAYAIYRLVEWRQGVRPEGSSAVEVKT